MKPLCTLLFLIMTGTTLSFGANPEPPRLKSGLNDLEVVFEGDYFILYSSGNRIRTGRNRKSGVWNTPARKATEMWVRRAGKEEVIRLHPYHFQRQLLQLLPDYPEVHGFIQDPSFDYRELEELIPELDQHLLRVEEIREDKHQIMEVEPEVLNR